MGRPLKQVRGVYEYPAGSGVWYIRYRQDGKLIRKSIGSRDDAINEMDKVQLIRRTGSGVIAKSAKQHTRTLDELAAMGGSGTTLDAFIDDYITYISDPTNSEAPRDIINPTQRLQRVKESPLASRPATSIKPFEIEDWLRSLRTIGQKGRRKQTQKRLAAGTMNRYKSDLSGVYRYAKRRGRIEHNPVRDAKQFKVSQSGVPRWLRDDEETALRNVLQRWIADCPKQFRMRGLVLQCHPHELSLALGTGMRAGNLYNLRWEHVDFANRCINLPRTKNGKPQTIPMIGDVYKALKQLQVIQDQMRPVQDEFLSKKGEDHQLRMPIDGKVILWAAPRKWWLAALAEAKIVDLRWHDLRHTFATRLMKLTGNLKIVQEACHHANISMTARYAHVSQTDLSAAMEGLNRKAA
jgi:integrase